MCYNKKLQILTFFIKKWSLEFNSHGEFTDTCTQFIEFRTVLQPIKLNNTLIITF